jgi:hypothetical protein
MRGLPVALAAVTAVVLSAAPAGATAPDRVMRHDSATAMPRLYKNCKNLNRKYPHGIGRPNAHDKTKGETEPVTNFRRSTRLYRRAMSHNRGLDRDKDGIACEKL